MPQEKLDATERFLRPWNISHGALATLMPRQIERECGRLVMAQQDRLRDSGSHSEVYAR
jgi:hypothetical protein